MFHISSYLIAIFLQTEGISIHVTWSCGKVETHLKTNQAKNNLLVQGKLGYLQMWFGFIGLTMGIPCKRPSVIEKTYKTPSKVCKNLTISDRRKNIKAFDLLNLFRIFKAYELIYCAMIKIILITKKVWESYKTLTKTYFACS